MRGCKLASTPATRMPDKGNGPRPECLASAAHGRAGHERPGADRIDAATTRTGGRLTMATHQAQPAKRSWRPCLPIHPAASKMVPFGLKALKELAGDIQRQGQRETVKLVDKDGQLWLID